MLVDRSRIAETLNERCSCHRHIVWPWPERSGRAGLVGLAGPMGGRQSPRHEASQPLSRLPVPGRGDPACGVAHMRGSAVKGSCCTLLRIWIRGLSPPRSAAAPVPHKLTSGRRLERLHHNPSSSRSPGSGERNQSLPRRVSALQTGGPLVWIRRGNKPRAECTAGLMGADQAPFSTAPSGTTPWVA